MTDLPFEGRVEKEIVEGGRVDTVSTMEGGRGVIGEEKGDKRVRGGTDLEIFELSPGRLK